MKQASHHHVLNVRNMKKILFLSKPWLSAHVDAVRWISRDKLLLNCFHVYFQSLEPTKTNPRHSICYEKNIYLFQIEIFKASSRFRLLFCIMPPTLFCSCLREHSKLGFRVNQVNKKVLISISKELNWESERKFYCFLHLLPSSSMKTLKWIFFSFKIRSLCRRLLLLLMFVPLPKLIILYLHIYLINNSDFNLMIICERLTGVLN